MPSIKKEYFIAVSPRVLWEAITNCTMLNGWGAGPDPIMDMQEGGEFSLWGGSIHGKNLEFDEEWRLVQEWITEGYDYPTEVTIALKPSEEDGEEGTALTIIQTDVREDDVEEFDRGWDDFYVGPLKEFCEQQT